jgi:site-specific DNA recombinase
VLGLFLQSLHWRKIARRTGHRPKRRSDAKWLASTIHGDPNRGTGILNNRRYLGVSVWGRSEWKRPAAGSKRRRYWMLASGSAHERGDESLRIVSHLKCSGCSGSFVLTNAVRYQCASHHYGGDAACSIGLSIPRERVETKVLECVESDLLNVDRFIG